MDRMKVIVISDVMNCSLFSCGVGIWMELRDDQVRMILQTQTYLQLCLLLHLSIALRLYCMPGPIKQWAGSSPTLFKPNEVSL
ncbi:hypothetical protein BJ138DRAFT_1157397 [Hygrophoropsis aurantiaca]|uniref:Uncharacterized protein n=1 Tax=Hygrophoropsis aurantiaca TaxID=72124 RepID=A0ACB8A5S0_9AGAM|nr:hypothetical protein BJ138DRAFT_1157397 [Hygrophoropsis aurantiaca]